MTQGEFILWLRGYIEGIDVACGNTSKTDTIKEKLNQIKSSESTLLKG
jgi:hypothetical protein